MIEIVSAPQATLEQMTSWAMSKNATSEFIELADLYWTLGQALGINPEGAYCQSAKETGYGKFGGVINASYHNPCGMKISEGGDNYNPDAHQDFPDWPSGVMAHLDHLALYAGKEGYPKTPTYDPRHFTFVLGSAPTFFELGTRWAPSATYGQSIETMIEELRSTAILTEIAPESEDVSELKATIAYLEGKLLALKTILD